jgi:V8-like Glu-specific endopeptidase
MSWRFRYTFLLIAVTVLGPAAKAAEEPIFRHYSDDEKLRASLRWIGLRPGVTHAIALPAAPVARGVAPSSKASKLTVEKLSNFPASAIGKLLFIKPSGATGSCTATFVAGKNILLTAANCIISESGLPNKDHVFITSYGTEAQQLYDISCIAFPSEWTRHSGADRWRHNYAFLVTGRNSIFGGLGLTNALVPRKISQLGYADAAGEGRQIRGVDSGAYMTKDGLVGTIYTALGAGSSGNPWVRSSIIYSLSSHYDPEHPSVLLGPRITAATMALLSRVRKEC